MGGASQIYPYKKREGGGEQKILVMLKPGGGGKFSGSFQVEYLVLTIIEEGTAVSTL